MLTSFGLEQRVDQPTHDQNGILNVVITRTDLPPLFIKVTDFGLSDHRPVQWSLELQITTPVYETISRRAWRSFSIETFKSELQNSLLCDMCIIISPAHPDEMVKHYSDVITNLLDRSPVVDESQTSDMIGVVTNLSSVFDDSSGDISPHSAIGRQLTARCPYRPR